MSPEDVTPPPHAVVLEPYDPRWPALAAQETLRLRQALGANLILVEHFGSTAVPGLAAKPVIDLMLLVADQAALDRDRPTIEALGFEWYGEFGIPGRRFCTFTDADGVRRIHLHGYAANSPQVGRHLIFRDYLRTHPHEARAYEREKRRAAALHPRDSLAYHDEKDAWVSACEARALVWRADRPGN